MKVISGIQFKCWKRSGRANKITDEWFGTIVEFWNHNGYYEIFIQSRSSIRVLFGKSSYGWWACIPDWKAGSHLSGLEDRMWNLERLEMAMKNKIDAITVTHALCAIAKKVTEIECA